MEKTPYYAFVKYKKKDYDNLYIDLRIYVYIYIYMYMYI